MAGTTARAASLPNATEAAAPSATRSRESELASAVKALIVAGQRDRARERFGELVACQQRRAVRIAFHYLRDAHDADEAVQDAFLKVFTHITTYRDALPFEVWFTRILVNRCLDVRKARARRLKWALPMTLSGDLRVPDRPTPQASAEELLISDERRRTIGEAVEKLPNRQRAVFTLCHIADQTTTATTIFFIVRPTDVPPGATLLSDATAGGLDCRDAVASRRRRLLHAGIVH